ncbi:MAG TPA: hypothetical protein VEU33_10305, partial [Archangium sp.]|nr:hypothetical protein [Archangium sp.]
MCLPSPALSPVERRRATCGVLTLALLVLGGCATGAPLAGLLASPRSHRLTPAFSTQTRPPRLVDDSVWTAVPPEDSPAPDEDDDPEDDLEEGPGAPVRTAAG